MKNLFKKLGIALILVFALIIPAWAISYNIGATVFSSTVTSTANDLGWSIVAGADTACTTTCTNACVMGFAINADGGSDPVNCASATADNCLCGGAS